MNRKHVVLLACIPLVLGSQRETATFDFGWRHRLGLHADGAPPQGSAWPLPNNTGPGTKPAPAQLGYDDSDWSRVRLPHDGLVAEGPSNVTCPSGCSGRSFIPRSVMWYRKSFMLLADWWVPVDVDADRSSIWLEFDGVFRSTIVYLNGVIVAQNAQGYLGFDVSLSSPAAVAALRSNPDPAEQPHVLALFVDPDTGAGFSPSRRSGWWYEGGGLYRHARIVKANPLNFAPYGVVARSSVSGTSSAVLQLLGTVRNQGSKPVADGRASIEFTVVGPDGRLAAGPIRASLGAVAGTGGTKTVNATATVTGSALKLWSAQSPALYVVSARILFVSPAPEVEADVVNITHGIRTIVFRGADAGPSCTVNGKPWKWRGFCDHDNFAVVGMAVPDRIKLFRAQMSRAVGGNSRRTSHNPPDPVMLDIYDRLGMLVMDETRQFNSRPNSVANMATMVRRDRNHPSVAMWSFCNEVFCEPPSTDLNASEPQAGALPFHTVTMAADPTRPTAANTPGWHGHWPPFIADDRLTNTIEIQGFSHAGGGPSGSPALFHKMHPNKPVFGSECCSCNTFRDEDVGCTSSNGQQICIQKSFAADCSQTQTNVYNLPKWAVGTMVWTLFDYIGEPSGTWPNVIGSFGQFDVAGFPKGQAFWYKSQWLLRIDDSSADKPFVTGANSSNPPLHQVRIVESWEKPSSNPPPGYPAPDNWPVPARCNLTYFRETCSPNASVSLDSCMECMQEHQIRMCQAQCCGEDTWATLCRTHGVKPPPSPPIATNKKNITVYSDGASVELFVNGKLQSAQALPIQPTGGDGIGTVQTWAQWNDIEWSAGNITAVARDAAGRRVAAHTRATNGPVARLMLSLDAPSPKSGTGSKLLLDGQDAALIRASVLDASGQVVHNAANVITFAVVSGPGMLQGAHNGKNFQHGRSDANSVEAYHGLARAVVRSTSVAARPEAERRLMVAIDVDTEEGVGLNPNVEGDSATSDIHVTATTPGIPTASIVIPVSLDPMSDSVLAVANAAAGSMVSF